MDMHSPNVDDGPIRLVSDLDFVTMDKMEPLGINLTMTSFLGVNLSLYRLIRG